MAGLKEILSWFEKNKYPTQEQFKESWTSFWHKSEKMPMEQVVGLQDELSNKALKSDLNAVETELKDKASKEELANVVAGLVPMGSVANLAELETKPKRNNDAYYVEDQLSPEGDAYIYRWDAGLSKWINTKQVVFLNTIKYSDLTDLENKSLEVSNFISNNLSSTYDAIDVKPIEFNYLDNSYIETNGIIIPYSIAPNIIRIKYSLLKAGKKYCLRSFNYSRGSSNPLPSISISNEEPKLYNKTNIVRYDAKIPTYIDTIYTPLSNSYILIVENIESKTTIDITEVSRIIKLETTEVLSALGSSTKHTLSQKTVSEQLSKKPYEVSLNYTFPQKYILANEIESVSIIENVYIDEYAKLVSRVGYNLLVIPVIKSVSYVVKGNLYRDNNVPVVGFGLNEPKPNDFIQPVLWGTQAHIPTEFIWHCEENGVLLVQEINNETLSVFRAVNVGKIDVSDELGDSQSLSVSQRTITNELSKKISLPKLRVKEEDYISTCLAVIKYANNIFYNKDTFVRKVLIKSKRNTIANYGIVEKKGEEFLFGDKIGELEVVEGVNFCSIDILLKENTTLWFSTNSGIRAISMAVVKEFPRVGIVTDEAGVNYNYTLAAYLYDEIFFENNLGESQILGVNQKTITDNFNKVNNRIDLFSDTMFTQIEPNNGFLINSLDVVKAGFNSIDSFRIPAIEHAPNGNILYFNEAKYNSSSDFAPCDISMCIIQDKIVRKCVTLLKHSSEYPLYRYPCTLRINNRNYLFYNKTNGLYSFIDNRCINHICYIYSDDCGLNWSDEYILHTCNLNDDFKFGIGTTNGIQHSNGKIIIPLWGSKAQLWDGADRKHFKAGIMIFDEDTKDVVFKWLPIEKIDVQGTNEAQVVELINGDLLLDSRTQSNRRTVYTSSDFGETWLPASNNNYNAPLCLNPLRRYGDKFIQAEGLNRSVSLQLKISTDATNFKKIADITNKYEQHFGYSSISCFGDDVCIATEPKNDKGKADARLIYVTKEMSFDIIEDWII